MDRIDGEPMEFEWKNLPSIQHIAAQPQSPRGTVKIKRNTRKVYWTDHLHVDVQRHLMGIERTTRENAIRRLNSFLYLREDSEQKNGHSSDLDRRKSGALLVKKSRQENGTKWRKR